MSAPNNDTPPSYNENLPVLYDETFRGIWGAGFGVASLGNRANLIGYLEHYAPTTDGSFAICIAGGKGVVISKALYESIPEAHRPPLDTSHTQPVAFMITGGSQTAIGSTIIPIILKNADTGKFFKIKIYALVVENLLMGMFIGQGSAGTVAQEWGGGVTHVFNFGHEDIRVKGC